jgi:hypothetical protein
MLRAGLLGVAGVSLPDLLRLRARSSEGVSRRDTAVIFILQEGGATQFETYDPKPLAPVEIRGEFKAIATSVPGVQFSELMAEQAKIMHRLTLLRSIHHPSTQHSSSVHLIKTGYYCRAEANENEMPSLGAYTAKLRGPTAPNVPPYVLIHNGERYDGGHFLGRAYQPFLAKTHEDKPTFQLPNLTLLEGIGAAQLAERRTLLAGFDEARRIWDTRGMVEAADQFQHQAFDMVTGPAARRAFNLDAEPLALRERYGMNRLGQRMLLARRLVEHGVTFITVGTFGWDHHNDLWPDMRRNGPAFDRGMAALVEDLAARGLDRRVLVVVMGEFGREPRITSLPKLTPGRDHWGDVMSVLLAGGGLTGGQVIGASDTKGARPAQSPHRLEKVLAVMYRHLGIDPALTFPDHTGRPRNLLEIREPIEELEGA